MSVVNKVEDIVPVAAVDISVVKSVISECVELKVSVVVNVGPGILVISEVEGNC